jgi:hypothetical protein
MNVDRARVFESKDFDVEAVRGQCWQDLEARPGDVKQEVANYIESSKFAMVGSKYNINGDRAIKMFNRHFANSLGHISPEIVEFLVMLRLDERIRNVYATGHPIVNPREALKVLVIKLNELDETCEKLVFPHLAKWVDANMEKLVRNPKYDVIVENDEPKIVVAGYST